MMGYGMDGDDKKGRRWNSADMSINIDSKPFTLINLPVIDWLSLNVLYLFARTN